MKTSLFKILKRVLSLFILLLSFVNIINAQVEYECHMVDVNIANNEGSEKYYGCTDNSDFDTYHGAVTRYFKSGNILTNGSMENNWQVLGPDNIVKQNLGIVVCIAVDPNNKNIIYAGTNSSGLWKTIDGGVNWNNITEGISISSFGVEWVELDPNNSDIIFISTGLANEGIINYNTRTSNSNPVFTIGVYRSVDYGESWEPINSGLFESFSGSATIRRMIINPDNPNQLFIATSQGIFRTNNANSSNPVWEQ